MAATLLESTGAMINPTPKERPTGHPRFVGWQSLKVNVSFEHQQSDNNLARFSDRDTARQCYCFREVFPKNTISRLTGDTSQWDNPQQVEWIAVKSDETNGNGIREKPILVFGRPPVTQLPDIGPLLSRDCIGERNLDRFDVAMLKGGA